MSNKRLCTVRGIDKTGLPIAGTVEAYSVFEAAARGMDEIRNRRGRSSELTVIEHLPGKQYTVTRDQLIDWVSKRGPEDNIGLRVIKKNVGDFLRQRHESTDDG